jgi:hypothetical protein
LGDLVSEAAVVADGDDAVAAADQFGAEFPVAGDLSGVVVDGTVAEDADVRRVVEIRDAARFGDGLLGLVGEAVRGRRTSRSSWSLGRSTHSRLKRRVQAQLRGWVLRKDHKEIKEGDISAFRFPLFQFNSPS